MPERFLRALDNGLFVILECALVEVLVPVASFLSVEWGIMRGENGNSFAAAARINLTDDEG